MSYKLENENRKLTLRAECNLFIEQVESNCTFYKMKLQLRSNLKGTNRGGNQAFLKKKKIRSDPSF